MDKRVEELNIRVITELTVFVYHYTFLVELLKTCCELSQEEEHAAANHLARA
jgi:hypothetical protein